MESAHQYWKKEEIPRIGILYNTVGFSNKIVGKIMETHLLQWAVAITSSKCIGYSDIVCLYNLCTWSLWAFSSCENMIRLRKAKINSFF